MPNLNEKELNPAEEKLPSSTEQPKDIKHQDDKPVDMQTQATESAGMIPPIPSNTPEGRPVERTKGSGRPGARGTAAMDPQTRKEVARKGGLAVSRNKQHMAEIGRKGGQSVSKNREHMAQIGRKGGAASRGHR